MVAVDLSGQGVGRWGPPDVGSRSGLKKAACRRGEAFERAAHRRGKSSGDIGAGRARLPHIGCTLRSSSATLEGQLLLRRAGILRGKRPPRNRAAGRPHALRSRVCRGSTDGIHPFLLSARRTSEVPKKQADADEGYPGPAHRSRTRSSGGARGTPPSPETPERQIPLLGPRRRRGFAAVVAEVIARPFSQQGENPQQDFFLVRVDGYRHPGGSFCSGVQASIRLSREIAGRSREVEASAFARAHRHGGKVAVRRSVRQTQAAIRLDFSAGPPCRPSPLRGRGSRRTALSGLCLGQRGEKKKTKSNGGRRTGRAFPAGVTAGNRSSSQADGRGRLSAHRS